MLRHRLGARMTTMAKIRGERSYWEQRYEEWWEHPYHGMSQATDEFMVREEDGIRAKLGSLLEPHHRVLDAGCGYGRIVPMICPHVSEYVGVDFSEKAIDAARATAPDNARFIVGDILDVTDTGFDVIVMVGLASSLSYRPEVIEHCRSLLAPGGCIAVFEYGNDRVLT